AVRETGYGRLAPADDPRGLADALGAVLTNRERHAPRRERIEALFEPADSLRRNEELLFRVVAERSAGKARRAAPRPPRPRDTRVEALLSSEADMAFRRRARLLLDFLAPRDGERILDCGAGIGFHSKALAAFARIRPSGLDLDLAKLATARRTGVPASLLAGDAAALPFAPASFDKALASEVLEHVPDDRRALAELHRVLKPGGFLAVSVPSANYPFAWDPINFVWTRLGGRPIRRGPLVGIWTDHVRLYRAEELARAVMESGFEVTRVEAATTFCLPFSHFLLYGVGKPLVEKRLLPAAIRRRVDRMSAASPPGRFHPLRLLERLDARNDGPDAEDVRRSVNVVLLARKPVP
ncbi:MAG TPA: methyltransferase domain-containing protein, partial [Thermoanaerobaculia bacterium]|nr:methyltransferase domain-containing protein [Thermoanaerobaculia bacterium]